MVLSPPGSPRDPKDHPEASREQFGSCVGPILDRFWDPDPFWNDFGRVLGRFSSIFEWIEPVGYHAWGADEDLVMFLLGEPHTLQYTRVAAAKPRVIAGDIGRTLIFDKHTNSYLFNYNKNHYSFLSLLFISLIFSMGS